MKKRLITVTTLAVLLLSLVACGKTESAPPEEASTPPETATTAPTATPAATPTPEPTEEPKPAQNMTASLATRDVTVAGVELTERNGVETIRVYYDVTNTSQKIIQPLWSVSMAAYQNDEKLSPNISTLDGVEEYDNGGRRIFPGVTLRACENYELLDTSLITLEIGDNSGDPVITIELDIADLPAVTPAPAVVPIPTPEDITAWAGYQGLEHDFEPTSLGNSLTLKLVKHEIVEHNGDNFLRLYFDCTLLAKKDDTNVSAFMYSRYYIYQDGILIGSDTTMDELGYKLPDVEDYDDHSLNIEIGETSHYVVSRRLRSDSDVIFMAVNFGNNPINGDAFIGAVIPVK